MVKTLFGGSESRQQSTNSSGFGALPEDLQARFTQLGNLGSNILNSASQYFSPIGLTSGENQAAQLIDPANFGASVQQYLNPYRDIITQDINEAYEDEYSALKSRASEAGAFGGSRMRMGESDLERSRLDAIINALSGQYGQASNQLQQGISNLLGFGQLERGIDLAQRQAPVAAFSTVSSGLSPLLNASQGNSSGNSDSQGGIVPGLSGFFSDADIKENIKRVGKKNGFNLYEFNYIGDQGNRYRGVMAQEVQNIMPEAVFEIDGIKAVNYNMIGIPMERA